VHRDAIRRRRSQDDRTCDVSSSVVVLGKSSRLRDQPAMRLSRKQRAVVAYIEHNPKFAAFATAAELGGRTGVHPSTVVRLSQLLGYRGFPDFQEEIRHQYLSSLDAVGLMRANAGETHGDIALASIDQDLRNLSATRASLDGDAIRRAARIIEQAPAVLILGAGTHAGLAIIFSHLCRFMGLPVDAEIRGSVSLAARLSAVGPGDVVIGTAAWWVMQETREAIAFAHERGATTIAIVDSRASGLAQVAEHVLITRTESVSFFQSMIGPLSILNALIAELAASTDSAVQERMRVSTGLFERFGIAWHPGDTELEQTGTNDLEPTPVSLPIFAGPDANRRRPAPTKSSGEELPL
jgi:DNA-binding MurR/RpiR family transcriptional regulator